MLAHSVLTVPDSLLPVPASLLELSACSMALLNVLVLFFEFVTPPFAHHVYSPRAALHVH